jgi:hypothetical protein
MADEPNPKLEVTVDGCVLWFIAGSLMSSATALYAIASAIKALGHG